MNKKRKVRRAMHYDFGPELNIPLAADGRDKCPRHKCQVTINSQSIQCQSLTRKPIQSWRGKKNHVTPISFDPNASINSVQLTHFITMK